MSGKFVHAGDIERESLDWGGLGWISRPSSTGSGRLTVLDVTLEPGHGHDFHKHPDQEEVIVVQSGEIEQWLEGERARPSSSAPARCTPRSTRGARPPG